MNAAASADRGLDLSGAMPSIRPQDDLFQYVNGQWLEVTPIPEDQARLSSFSDLTETTHAQLRALCEEAAVLTPEQSAHSRRVGKLYMSYLAEEMRERLGTTPVEADLRMVSRVCDLSALAFALGDLQRKGVVGAFHPHVTPDPMHSDRYILQLSQAGIGLPDESYFRDSKWTDHVAAYVRHVDRMLHLVDDPAFAGDRASGPEIVGLETAMAAAHWNSVSVRDERRSYNLYARATLERLIPAFDWGAWLAGLAAPTDAMERVVVRQPSFLRVFAELLTSVDLRQWRGWLSWRILSTAAPLLTREISQERFSFHGAVLTGAVRQRTQVRRAVDMVSATLGEDLGRLYVEKHFPPSSKTSIADMVAHLVTAYRHSILRLDWMSEVTRAEALSKLDAISCKVGYPDHWASSDCLQMRPTDLVGNVQRASAHESDRSFAKLGQPVDRNEWFVTPQTVNAYYNAALNEIVFPAAILQRPFFDPGAARAVNFGAIGAAIGHELVHAFDDQGSRYDERGQLRDWWSSEDRVAFENRAEALVYQYDAMEPAELPGQRVNGSLTLGENIGDLAGLTMAHRALVLCAAEANEDVGGADSRALFMAWARMWRGKSRRAEAARRLAVDPHAPLELRCNATVRNLDEFHTAFGVARGDALWLAPQGRVRIW